VTQIVLEEVMNYYLVQAQRKLWTTYFRHSVSCLRITSPV